jgi:filamentous hemagglutinin
VQSAGRIIGAVTGAAITNSAKGASSGASAAENVLVYNFLMHDEPAKMAKKLADCKGNSGCEINVRREMAQLSAKNEKSFESCRISGNGTVSTICYWGSLMQQASGTGSPTGI